MYGKFGRGGGPRGGGGGGQRNSFPPPHQRISSSSRPSLSSSSQKPSSATTTPPPPPPPPPSQTDESFSLVSGDPPAFAAIIRLAPDLVDEIKRAESNGGDARIKFDSSSNNSSGNVIDVDGKEFRFTWSHETGGLCDIYEERQNGVDGNGLLVESGCLLRKLNVQRVLDESTKKQVKKRSEEYEQKQKSRKAIVLDQCNPSMKKQMQDLAAAEASPWKFKQKNKRYFEPPQAGSHPKPVKPTTGFPAAINAKARRSTSPLPSPQNQPISLTSAFVKGNAMESQIVLENQSNRQGRAKENVAGSQNDYVAQVSGRTLEAVHRDNQGVGKLDLRNLLVTLLKSNPKGMSLKALEKASGDMSSSSACKLEPILKKIATYEPPGRYILKSGVELENLKRSYSDSGSSPEDNNEKQIIPEDNHGEVPAPDTDYAGKSPAGDLTENTQKFHNESNMVEKFDASQHFSDLFGDDEPPEKNEGRSARSNNSESDSDSDTGSSDSASRSRSRSLAGSGSASSSDSEGDDSSANSKEASDVDIDIMSNDDNEPNKLQGTVQELTTAPVSWSMPGAMALPDGRNGDQDGYTSEDVDIDIENDYIDVNEAHLAMGTHNISVTTQNLRTVSPDNDQNQPTNRTVVNEREDIEDESQYEHQRSIMLASKSKRGSKGIQFEHDADHAKRFKSNTVQSSISRNTGSRSLGSPLARSAHGINEDNHETRNLQMSNQLNKDDNTNTHLGTKKGLDSFSPGKSAAESLQSGRRPPARSYNTETTDKAFKNPPNPGIESNYLETNAYTQENFLKHEEKGYRDVDNEEYSSNDKANGKVNESPVQKHSLRPEPNHRKHSEWDKRSRSGTVTRPSLIDSGKAVFDRSPADKKRLQRELSDLELGELREPLIEVPEGTKRQQVERVGSFKQSEMILGNSGSQIAELKNKSTSKPVMESGYTSPPNARGPPNSDSSSRRYLEPYAEDSSCPDGALQPQLQQSRNGHAKVGSLPYKAVNHDRVLQNETVGNQGTDIEGYGETQKKSHVISQHEELRQGIGLHKGKGNKSKKSNGSKDASDSRRNGSNVHGRKDKRKRSESSSEENISFTKYEKEEPELKESIKSFSQYKDYVQEYKEKYESYCSLHKILETYKNEFQKLGMDLDAAKGRDKERYHDILSQLRERYNRCGKRYKRLKKIFLVLHEELKHLKQMIKEFAADYTRE